MILQEPDDLGPGIRLGERCFGSDADGQPGDRPSLAAGQEHEGNNSRQNERDFHIHIIRRFLETRADSRRPSGRPAAARPPETKAAEQVNLPVLATDQAFVDAARKTGNDADGAKKEGPPRRCLTAPCPDAIVPTGGQHEKSDRRFVRAAPGLGGVRPDLVQGLGRRGRGQGQA